MLMPIAGVALNFFAKVTVKSPLVEVVPDPLIVLVGALEATLNCSIAIRAVLSPPVVTSAFNS
jgi:hypothetical protein